MQTKANNFPFLTGVPTESIRTSVMIHGQKVIPSNTFMIGENEYILLEIFEEREQVILKIMGLYGEHISQIYQIALDRFEEMSHQELTSFFAHQ